MPAGFAPSPRTTVVTGSFAVAPTAAIDITTASWYVNVTESPTFSSAKRFISGPQ